jgi:RHS repeat-associated protein
MKQSVRNKHLGSAAYLTCQGNVIQTLNYLPYGEEWVEHNLSHPVDTTRLGIYRFNGKEKDYESGFHYYGARYYWSEDLTGWLSVDPMTDELPSISSYSYCNGNPVVMKDPDGEFPVLTALAGGIIGGVTSGVYAVLEGKSTTEIIAATAGGAVGGAIKGTGFLGGTVSGLAAEDTEQALNNMFGNQEGVNITALVTSTATGAVGGKVSKKAETSIEKNL